MLPLHSYLVFLGVYIVAAATPGPAVMAITARALGSGFRAALPMVLGTAVGDMAVLTLSVCGLAVVAQAMGHLFVAVKIAGALYLIYLGYKYWTAPVTELLDKPVDARRGFLAQFALTIGNPKAIAFWVALLPAVVDLRQLNLAVYLQLALACFTLTPLIMAAYAALASRVRGFLTGIKARRRINKGAGVIMVGAGVGVAVS